MRKGLFIAHNTFMLMEFINVREIYLKDAFFDVTISTEYNKTKEQFSSMSSIIYDCIDNELFENVIDFKEIQENSYDLIVCPSTFNEVTASKLKKINAKELHFIEEGLDDYCFTEEQSLQKDLLRTGVLYLHNPDLVYEKNLYKEIKKIYKTPESKDLTNRIFYIMYRELDKAENVDLILFTSPLLSINNISLRDLIVEYLEENYKGKNILIKQHPKDFNNYNSKEYKTIYLNRNLPGQIIEQFFDCEKLYMHPSTILISSSDTSKSKIVQFDIINEEAYINSFENMFVKKIKKEHI